jgi:hypothetical protein
VKARVLNGLALALVVATGLVGVLYAVIAVEPMMPLNPFPPPTAPPVADADGGGNGDAGAHAHALPHPNGPAPGPADADAGAVLPLHGDR